MGTIIPTTLTTNAGTPIAIPMIPPVSRVDLECDVGDGSEPVADGEGLCAPDVIEDVELVSGGVVGLVVVRYRVNVPPPQPIFVRGFGSPICS